MKKTLFAFSVTVVLSIAVFLTIGLTGCDWFNTTILGKPSQTELAEREKQRQEQLTQLDSVRRAEAEKLANLQAKNSLHSDGNGDNSNNHGGGGKSYHVILGCYEEQANIDNMITFLKEKGYNPYTFPIGGLTAVAAVSFDTEQQAMAEIYKMEDRDFSEDLELEDDIWVYKKP